jgi:arylsulfatase A-like enzyme
MIALPLRLALAISLVLGAALPGGCSSPSPERSEPGNAPAVGEAPTEMSDGSTPAPTNDLRPVPGTGPRYGSAPSSLVLVTLDTTRPDHLGAYGGEAKVSPVFDSLARTGILFEACDSASPLTLPSHATMLTGLYPAAHGLRTNGSGRLGPSLPTLASVLADRGWRTAAFLSSSVLDRRHGLDRGFEIYDDRMDASGERRGDETLRRALAWLQSAPGEPYLLWLHLFDPHAPYRPPEPYATLHRESPYDGEIAFADAMLGRLLAHLWRGTAPTSDGPLLCVVGDHGEGLGDHGEAEHGLLLYQSTLAVPLLIAGSDLEPRRVSRPVRTVDLFPTLLALLEVPPPPGARPGRDLRLHHRQADLPTAGGDAYAETLMPQRDYGWSPLFSLRREHLKVMEGTFASLFDLRQDPGETRELPADPPHRLLEELQRWRRQAETTGDRQRLHEPLSPDEIDRLRTLGYLGGSRATAPDAASSRVIDPRLQTGFHHQVKAALAFYRDGQYSRAAQDLEALLARQPDNPFLLDLAGSVALGRGRPEEAAQLYRASLARSPARGPVEVHLAEALLAAGQPAEAEATLRRSLEHLPTPPPVRAAVVLCRALIAQGRGPEGESAARRFVEQMAGEDPLLEELRELARGRP